MRRPRWMLAAALLGSTILEARAADPPPGPNPTAAAEAEAGRREEARASWWGFDPADSTRALQAAIDSKARRILVENMGSPWVIDETRLRGDLEIVFEPGVEVRAKRGAFRGGNASLFRASGVKNLTLRGPGATLRMWREDYDDPKQYKKAEWRHVMDLRSCSRVRVLGLTLAESGGDGIYLGVDGNGGPNVDVLIQDVTCDRNYRQGISVISARGLTIERCVLKNTAGTAPMAGIDFEPNLPGEEIVNCVMRDCLTENNAGGGYQFYLRPLEASSRPVSVRLERCRSANDSSGFGLNAGARDGAEPSSGEIVAADCEFVGSASAGIAIGPKSADRFSVRFEKCRIVDASIKHPEGAPIRFSNEGDAPDDAGGVAFVDCVVVDPVDRRPIGFHDAAGGARLVGVTGALIVERGGRRESIALDQPRIDAWFPFATIRRFPPHPGRAGPFEPVAPTAVAASWSCGFLQRGRAEWLVWAEAGDEVKLTVRVLPVGRMDPPPAPLARFDPSGKETSLGRVEGTLAVAFRAEQSGAHRIVCEPGSATASIAESNRRVCMIAPRRPSFHLLGSAGNLSFLVPAGTEAFAARVSCESPGESVKATLLDPAGATVEQRDDIDAHQFLVERPPSSTDAIWTLRLERPSKGVLEDVRVDLLGVPPILAPSPDALLKPSSPISASTP